MGWFAAGDDGELIGDRAADAVGEMVEQVKLIYNDEIGRPPTRGEWEALLSFVFRTTDPDHRPLSRRIVERVRIRSRPLRNGER